MYDSRGNLTSLTVDPGASPHLNQATTFTYDGDGNQLTKTDPGGSCTGNVSGCTTYAYNADNQVCWYLIGGSSNGCGSVPSGAVSYAYDNDGQRVAMSDATGSWSYTIDSLHRLSSVSEGQGGGASATIGYQYNYRNEPTQITYPGTTGSVTIGYDNAGREHTVQDWNNHTTTFNYDADSNLTTTVFPGGSCAMPVLLCDTNTYNAADQLTGISDLRIPVMTIFSATYTRDGNGQINSDSSAPSSQNVYGYTALNQVCYAGSNNTSACSSPPSASQAFGYDNGDNVTTMGTTTQSYNTGDELCWTVGGTSSNGCASPPSGARSFGYDSRDNRISAVPSTGSAMCYSYSEPNWLTQIQAGSGASCSSPTTVATYLNSGDGMRMSKTVGSTTTRTAWDLSGSVPLQLVDGSTDYVYGPGGMVLEQISGSTTLWYHHDQAGGVRAIVDSMGNVKATYTFDPYGNVLACTGASVTVTGANICTGLITVSNPFAFDGQYRDDESGLYYLRARYYDPPTGQFLSRDPLVETTRSAYGYAGGNPVNAADPSGTELCNPIQQRTMGLLTSDCEDPYTVAQQCTDRHSCEDTDRAFNAQLWTDSLYRPAASRSCDINDLNRYDAELRGYDKQVNQWLRNDNFGHRVSSGFKTARNLTIGPGVPGEGGILGPVNYGTGGGAIGWRVAYPRLSLGPSLFAGTAGGYVGGFLFGFFHNNEYAIG